MLRDKESIIVTELIPIETEVALAFYILIIYYILTYYIDIILMRILFDNIYNKYNFDIYSLQYYWHT